MKCHSCDRRLHPGNTSAQWADTCTTCAAQLRNPPMTKERKPTMSKLSTAVWPTVNDLIAALQALPPEDRTRPVCVEDFWQDTTAIRAVAELTLCDEHLNDDALPTPVVLL